MYSDQVENVRMDFLIRLSPYSPTSSRIPSKINVIKLVINSEWFYGGKEKNMENCMYTFLH